jgi:hypothetical protein
LEGSSTSQTVILLFSLDFEILAYVMPVKNKPVSIATSFPAAQPRKKGTKKKYNNNSNKIKEKYIKQHLKMWEDGKQKKLEGNPI